MLILVLFRHQTVTLKEFQTFEDKSSAINQNTGVNERLTSMIRKWLRQGQKMAVGKPEYKATIEERLVSISSWFTYTFEQLRSPFLLWLLAENRLPVQSSCDGGNVGHTELHAKFGAWRKIKAG